MSLLQAVYIISITVLHTVSSSALYTKDANCTKNNLGIIGGHKVTIEDVPFIVALHRKIKNGTYEAICGGSIIHERFVLTAAHCLSSFRTTRKRVLIGSDRLHAGGVMVNVETEFCHEGYGHSGMHDDICLLKLSQPVSFGCKVAKVMLPDKGYELEDGAMVNVTGWGDREDQSDAESLENNLYQTAVPIVANECCTNIYKALNHDQICAGSVGHDSCQGDSGGPLTYNGVQVGIVSYGLWCGIHPGVYTKVASYLDWIEATIKGNL